MGDYKEYCEHKNIEEDLTFLESIMYLPAAAVDWTLDQWPGRTKISLSQSDPTTEKVIYDHEDSQIYAQSFDMVQ